MPRLKTTEIKNLGQNEATLVVDCNNLCHIAKHALRGLSFNDMSTGILFGFFRQILSLGMRFHTDKFVFCWDSRKSKRRDMCQTYKVRPKMERTPEEEWENKVLFEQFVELRQECIPAVGFVNNFIKTGYEADDLLASVVLNNGGKYIIVSTDNDLFQLLDHCCIFNPITKRIADAEWFSQTYNIDPSKWSEVKALAGCSSDTVQGVPGVGEKTAIKYLKGEVKRGGKLDEKLISGAYQEQIDLNRMLVTLPFPGTPELKVNGNGNGFNFDAFERICYTYGFNYFSKNMADWRKVFGSENGSR